MELGIHFAALITFICTVLTDPTTNRSEIQIGYHLEICDLYAKKTFFEVDIVAGFSWRIYYSWNIDMTHQCLDLTFQKPTAGTVNRFWSDMSEYLDTQPAWEAATLLMTMGNSNHQMLLFADQGPAGRFLGVPNIRRDSNVIVPKKSVPLLKFQLSLTNINGALFLIVMDCNIGVTTLSHRADLEPTFKIFNYAAAFTVPYPNGMQACTQVEHRAEKLFRQDYGDWTL